MCLCSDGGGGGIDGSGEVGGVDGSGGSSGVRNSGENIGFSVGGGGGSIVYRCGEGGLCRSSRYFSVGWGFAI